MSIFTRKPHDAVEDAAATVRLAQLCVQRGMGLVRWGPVPDTVPRTFFPTEAPPTPEDVFTLFELDPAEVGTCPIVCAGCATWVCALL